MKEVGEVPRCNCAVILGGGSKDNCGAKSQKCSCKGEFHDGGEDD